MTVLRWLLSHTGTSLSNPHTNVSMRTNYVQSTCFLPKKYKRFLQLENLLIDRSKQQAFGLSKLVGKSLSPDYESTPTGFQGLVQVTCS